ncbi:MAG: ABC transporter permease subunit [Clostridiales bacterium]|nr:ABC transporter permease subunit [Clostridiales bacterium]
MKLNNPVLRSELKVKMRSFRTILGIILYVGILVFIASLYYSIASQNRGYGYGAINANRELGSTLYTLIAIFQFALIMVIAPAQTSGAISGERERQTLDLLLCTRMSAFEIIVGKLISSLAFILLLVVSSLPLFSLVFLFGGITPGDLITLFFFYIIIAMAVGSISIFFSTVFKRTMVATVVTYAVIFAWYVLTLIISIYLMSRHYMDPNASAQYVPKILYLNPMFGLGDIISRQLGADAQAGFRSFFGLRMGGSGQVPNISINPWIANVTLMFILTGIMITISSIRIRPVRIHRNMGRK